ncbi:MAG: molybdopterin dinucleotide binding domain-containing protein, partial [Candidatus Thorarchaeota archaeon]
LEELITRPEGIRTKAPSIPFQDREFLTKSGKVELYSSDLKEKGFDALPFYEEPAESPVSAKDTFKEYPLIMISGRLRDRLHSQYTTVTVGGTAKSFSHCTSCLKCIKDCPDEAITLCPPSAEQIQEQFDETPDSHAAMRTTLGSLVRDLAVTVSKDPLEIPRDLTGLLMPVWDSMKCIGCRECELDVCPYDVVNPTIQMHTRSSTEKKRLILRMHPDTGEALGLVNGDRVDIESKRGTIQGVCLELTDEIDPRVVWSSDGWWAEDGNINLLTEDKHTAFGHTPGFNSVLVRVVKSSTKA